MQPDSDDGNSVDLLEQQPGSVLTEGANLLDLPPECIHTIFTHLFAHLNSAQRLRYVSALNCKRLRPLLNAHIDREVHLKKASSLQRLSLRIVGSERCQRVLSLRLDMETEETTEGHIKNLWLALNTLIRLLPNLRSLQLNLSRLWTIYITDDRDAFSDTISSLAHLRRLGLKHIHQSNDFAVALMSASSIVKLLDPEKMQSLSLIGDGIQIGSEPSFDDERAAYLRIGPTLRTLDLSCSISGQLLTSILASTKNLRDLSLRLGPTSSPSPAIVTEALALVAPRLESLHLGCHGRTPENGTEILHRGILRNLGMNMVKLNQLTLDGAFWHRHLDECLPHSLEYLSFVITDKFPFPTLAVMIGMQKPRLKKIYIRGAFNAEGTFSALAHKGTLHAFKLACEQTGTYVGWLPYGVDSVPF